jgi:hypothetical protein
MTAVTGYTKNSSLRGWRREQLAGACDGRKPSNAASTKTMVARDNDRFSSIQLAPYPSISIHSVAITAHGQSKSNFQTCAKCRGRLEYPGRVSGCRACAHYGFQKQNRNRRVDERRSPYRLAALSGLREVVLSIVTARGTSGSVAGTIHSRRYVRSRTRLGRLSK